MKKYGIGVLIMACFAAASMAQLPGSNASAREYVIAGVIDSLRSTVLNETRVLNISLPEGYSPDSVKTYPVIYLLDGGAHEDFIHIAGLVRYNTTSWVNRFPQSIVVGIENVDRQRDFTFATPDLDFLTKIGFDKNAFKDHGGSEKFISFIEKELQPFIQTHYKAGAGKTIIGESLAGLLATEILLKKPSLFDTYIIISPSLWWGGESLLRGKTALSQKPLNGKLKIYIGAANKTEDLVMFRDAQQLAQLLRSYKQAGIKVTFDYLEDETHATIIHQAVYNAFKLLYPKTK